MADPRTHRLRLWTSALVVGAVVLAVLLVPPLVQLDEQAVDLSQKL
ncbi:ABC transporter permease, partial [Streptomyces hydrogenans]